MRRALALVTSTFLFVLLTAVPAAASGAVEGAGGTVKVLEDFAIIAAIALAAVVVCFIAVKTARKHGGKDEDAEKG
ncbi:MAG: hypothetical protein WC891_08270 [Actinomycetota bacterium]